MSSKRSRSHRRRQARSKSKSTRTVATPPPGPPPYGWPRGRGTPWIDGLICLLLVAATCVLYSSDLDLGFFHLDDPTYVTDNPHIKGFTGENLRFVLTQPYFANYSPTHLLSYMVDYAIGGEDPRVFHLSSNVWAGLAAAMVYLFGVVLLKRDDRPAWLTRFGAATAALLFVVHPAHVEAVAWISSRKDLIAVAFAMPSMIAYTAYRRRGRHRWLWYAISCVLFAVAIAGKLSVVVLPAMLVLLDWFVERRRSWTIIADKIPYGILVLLFGLIVMQSQPPTQLELSLAVVAHSTWHNLVLLGGFGSYVLSRGRPDLAWPAVWIASMLLLLLPLLASRRGPGRPIALFFFVVLALIPPQVLSFVNPVADRYLFFPSVGLTLLIGWGLVRLATRPRWGTPAAIAMAAAIAIYWTVRTTSYLGEWNDPRSVWLAATSKSDDPTVFQFLATHYQDTADQLDTLLRDEPERMRALAGALWNDDPRRAELLAEWEADERGSLTAAFKSTLIDEATRNFRLTLDHKRTRIMPNLYFRLGKLALERDELDQARRDFQAAVAESRRHTSPRVRSELAVRGYHALGLVEWTARDYPEALRWFRQAELAQSQSDIIFIPDLTAQRQRLEGLIDR